MNNVAATPSGVCFFLSAPNPTVTRSAIGIPNAAPKNPDGAGALIEPDGSNPRGAIGAADLGMPLKQITGLFVCVCVCVCVWGGGGGGVLIYSHFFCYLEHSPRNLLKSF